LQKSSSPWTIAERTPVRPHIAVGIRQGMNRRRDDTVEQSGRARLPDTLRFKIIINIRSMDSDIRV
jgi:hypothetical protein